MRKITVLFLTVMLVVGFAGLTQAKKAKPLDLAVITGISCGDVADGNGQKFQAEWSWEAIDDAPEHTKFGGDAIFKVAVYLDGAVDSIIVGLEVEIVKFDDSELDGYDDNKMSYYCEDSLCTGDAYPVTVTFIEEALDIMFPDAEVEYEIIGFGEEVWVKAMNPGVERTPQNYVKVNVCPEQ